jgi:5-(carboxyamino)imidazole ribonucleotide synthase
MRIGVIGAGQLGRMLALAGHPLGMSFCFLDPGEAPTAAALGEHIRAGFDDADQLNALAAASDVLTFEFENVPAEALGSLPASPALLPPPRALYYAQDRLQEKQLFAELDIATGPSYPVSSRQQLEAGVKALGLPAVLKTRRMGYDGKGQWLLRQPEDVADAWAALGEQPLLLEQFIAFDFEVSLVAVRGLDGSTAFYPLSRNHHEAGILHHSIAPYLDESLQAQARTALQKLLEHLDYVGVLTVEFFAHKGRLLANEMAPRVHNSGHWTIEGAVTSQFENHLRAIAGLPLGSTEATGHSAMVNFIGAMPPIAEVLALEHCHVHDYCKSARRGRKVGHATAVCDSAKSRDMALDTLLALRR